jgi:hypothetical protein
LRYCIHTILSQFTVPTFSSNFLFFVVCFRSSVKIRNYVLSISVTVCFVDAIRATVYLPTGSNTQYLLCFSMLPCTKSYFHLGVLCLKTIQLNRRYVQNSHRVQEYSAYGSDPILATGGIRKHCYLLHICYFPKKVKQS